MTGLIVSCVAAALALVAAIACVSVARSQSALTSKAIARSLELSFNRRELRQNEALEAQHEAFQSLRRDFAGLSEDCSRFLEDAGTKLKRATARNQRAEAAAPGFTSPDAVQVPPLDPQTAAQAAEKAWEREKRRRIVDAVK